MQVISNAIFEFEKRSFIHCFVKVDKSEPIKLKHVYIPPCNHYEELKVRYPFIDFSEQRFQIAMPYSNNEQETKFKVWDISAKQSDLF